MGGTWTFRDGLELAWERKGTILQWALVAATVGVILRTLEERLGLIGRLIMRLIGIAWTLACYFVVPVLAFEDLTPIDAVKRSSKLFRDTWGEKVIGGFSLSLVSLVLMLPGIGFVIVAAFLGGLNGLLFGDVSLFPPAFGFHVRGRRHLQRSALSLRLFQTGAAGVLPGIDRFCLGAQELTPCVLGGPQGPPAHSTHNFIVRFRHSTYNFVDCLRCSGAATLPARNDTLSNVHYLRGQPTVTQGAFSASKISTECWPPLYELARSSGTHNSLSPFAAVRRGGFRSPRARISRRNPRRRPGRKRRPSPGRENHCSGVRIFVPA